MAHRFFLILLQGFFLLTHSLAAEETVWKYGETSLSHIVVADSDARHQLLRLRGLKFNSANVTLLENPTRIVVDFLKANKRLHSTNTPKNTSTFTTVRLATHTDRVRMVVDIAPGQSKPVYTSINGADYFELKINDISPPEPKAVDATPLPATPLPPTVQVLGLTPTPIVEPTFTPAPSPEPQPTSAPPKPNTPQPLPKSAWHNSSAKRTLQDIVFEQAPKELPLIRIRLSDKPEFNLVKREDTLYSLIVLDSTMSGPHLALPQFPPHDFSGYNMVSAIQKGENTEFTILVDRGIRLNATPKGNEIWIRSLNR